MQMAEPSEAALREWLGPQGLVTRARAWGREEPASLECPCEVSRTPCGVHTAVPRFCREKKNKKQKKKKEKEKEKTNGKKTKTTTKTMTKTKTKKKKNRRRRIKKKKKHRKKTKKTKLKKK